ncbi:FeoB-associated Cys-rich membrane protein [Tenacibaculum sp. nBUS_03]|uniref:FeoB-associated Cys-rich membrane protein n=1 Tax=Tenacibaculum sp. nBUS_03 TaxID=3395320 RepID=UPI003EC12635
MACTSIGGYGYIGICICINFFSKPKLMQEIITYTIVFLAVVFLIRKFFVTSKNDKNCNKGCNCG